MLDINIEGMSEIESKFKDWANQAKNPKKLLEQLGKREVKRTRDRFQSKSTPDNKRWQIWDRDTQEQRAREGTGSAGILVRTGALLRSIRYQVKGDEVVVGSNLDYAAYQQFGTDNIPARPFLGFNDASNADITWLAETMFK